jgi:hypothetical protein
MMPPSAATLDSDFVSLKSSNLYLRRPVTGWHIEIHGRARRYLSHVRIGDPFPNAGLRDELRQ